MRDLIAAKSNIDQQDADGLTPLHRAAFNAKPSATRTLVRLKANLSIIDKDQRTPLEVADMAEGSAEKDIVIGVLQEAERDFARRNPK